MFRRAIKFGILGGCAAGTAISFHNNNYDWNGVGIVRLSRSAKAVVDIATIYKKELYFKEWDKSTKEYREQRSKTHQKAADRLLELLCLNRGVYLKIGQHIGSLEYLLPIEYVNTMKILHSQAPKNTLEEIYMVIRQDLKREPSELFEYFDPEPLGAASLAQVHKARLKNGKVVAVKVQHHYVRGNAMVDILTMEYCVRLMGLIFPDFNFQWLVEESKKNIPKELDFMTEGRNTERVRTQFKDVKWLKIPQIHWDLSTDRVLMMEYLEGGQVNDLEYIKKSNIDPFDVANKLGVLYSQMIFLNGYVHSDPHPGNILVHKNKKGGTDIILLDHGLYAELTNKFRYEYANLWLSILRVDRKGMRQHAYNLGITGDLYGVFACMVTGRPWEAIMAGISKKKPDSYEKEILLTGGALVLPDIADILEKVDRQMLLILKTNDLIRGIETTLKTQDRMTAFWVMSKCCVKSIRNERVVQSESYWKKFAITLRSTWSIFKINFFYIFMGLSQGNFFNTMKQLCL